jgi:hypothetical protein
VLATKDNTVHKATPGEIQTVSGGLNESKCIPLDYPSIFLCKGKFKKEQLPYTFFCSSVVYLIRGLGFGFTPVFI